MKAILTILCAGLMFWTLVGGRASADERRHEVRVAEDEVETLRVDVPRPQVTYVLLRAKLADRPKRTPGKLSARIQQALKRDPF